MPGNNWLLKLSTSSGPAIYAQRVNNRADGGWSVSLPGGGEGITLQGTVEALLSQLGEFAQVFGGIAGMERHNGNGWEPYSYGTRARGQALDEQRGYRNHSGSSARLLKPEPEPEVQRVVIKSLALMDAYLSRPSGGRARAYFEGVGQPQRASMQVG